MLGKKRFIIYPIHNAVLRDARSVKPLFVLLAGVVVLWMQPWSEATATPHASNGEVRRTTSSSRCLPGYRKSTLTGRCVRSGNRFFLLGVN